MPGVVGGVAGCVTYKCGGEAPVEGSHTSLTPHYGGAGMQDTKVPAPGGQVAR